MKRADSPVKPPTFEAVELDKEITDKFAKAEKQALDRIEALRAELLKDLEK